MIYLVVDYRYLHQYGLVRSMRFSRTFDNIKDALLYASRKDNWYDQHIISIENEEDYSISQQGE